MQETKPAYLSKTVLVNLIVAIAAFFPSVQAYISAHPEIFTYGFVIINIALRAITKSQIQIL